MQKTKMLLRFGVGGILLATGMIGLFAACNENPVNFNRASGAIEYIQPTTVGGGAELDMLWVIDNSGSMCQEQKTLRENFEQFINELNETNLDFHIGVTTTDMAANYSLEPVAQPGYLQATPQPVPGFDKDCHQRIDDNGERVPGDYTPIREAISVAVSCTTSGDESAYNWSVADIECALYGQPSGCSIAAAGCGGGGDACEADDLFPDPSDYRAIPKVLRSQDYRNPDGTLQVEQLKEDFACMSLVGTRGFGIEKGLAAAVQAVSPGMTGGPADVDPMTNDQVDSTKPNYGLLRKNARFALIFVTDENDCSDYPTIFTEEDCNAKFGGACPAINESTQCRDDVCDFANLESKGEASPLIQTDSVKEQLLANLSASKLRNDDPVGEGEVLVASIHGNSQRYTGAEASEDQCSMGCDPGMDDQCPDGMVCNEVGDTGNGKCEVPATCATALGVAFSGDRYERFLRTFPDGNFYPKPSEQNPDAALTGWMCNGDFAPALKAIGEFFRQVNTGCITKPILPCDGPGAGCPAFPYTGESGSCEEFPNSNGEQFYCTSGIQLRARVIDDAANATQVLQDSGYCIPESIGQPDFPNGCVIDSAKFDWIACPSGAAGLKLQWGNENEALTALQGTEIQVRYTSVSTPDEPAAQ